MLTGSFIIFNVPVVCSMVEAILADDVSTTVRSYLEPAVQLSEVVINEGSSSHDRVSSGVNCTSRNLETDFFQFYTVNRRIRLNHTRIVRYKSNDHDKTDISPGTDMCHK